MFERFSDRARRVVVLAQENARILNHGYIGTEHILLGLIQEGDGVAAKALESLNISLLETRRQIEEIIGRGEAVPTGHIPFTPRAKKVLELALREALQLGHNYIGTEHILLGLIREGEGVAAQVLQKLGAELPRVREAVVGLLSAYVRSPERTGFDPVRTWLQRLREARMIRRTLESAKDRMSRKGNETPTEEDIAEWIGISPAELSEIRRFRDVDFTTERFLLAEETRRAALPLAEWFVSLSEPDRSLLRRYYLEGLTIEEIGAEAGMDPAEIEESHRRLMASLGGALEDLPELSRRPMHDGPACSRCGASDASFRLAERRVQGDELDKVMEFMFCGACGSTITAWPAGGAESASQGEPASEG